MVRKLGSVRLPLKTTQLFLFVTVILGAGVFNIFTLYHTNRYMNIFDRSLVAYHSIQRFHRELESSVSSLRMYVRHREDTHLETVRRTRGELDRRLFEVRRHNSTGVEALFELRSLRNGLNAYHNAAENAMLAASENAPEHYRLLLRAERISEYLFIYLQRLMHARLAEGLETHATLRGHARAMGFGSLFGILVMGVLIMLFLVVFTRRITRPVRKLAAAAHRMAHGELGVGDVVVSSVEEIDVLAEAFNRMNKNIASLVSDLKDKSALERKLHREELKNVQMERSLEHARFQQLQAQVNPHFLFNSLNTIARAALFERAEQSARLIQALAQLLRHSLGTRSSMSSIERELEIVHEYLHIQEYRFRERLRFEVACDDGLGTVEIPCFSLQPLVENAVQHGIEPLENGGAVRITVRRSNHEVVLSVEDTGVGMSPERLREVSRGDGFQTAVERSDPSSSSIGIANVRERFELAYHHEARFEIESEPGLGTAVRITVPLEPHYRTVTPSAAEHANDL